jgi:glycerophosphoryl diester phosphodiesterase
VTRALVCAHRGLPSAREQENTMIAFRAAVEAGADMIEADVRRGRDGDIVLSHGRVAAGARPARLCELLELTAGRIALDLELKEPGIEAALLAAVEPRPAGLVVTSFLPTVLGELSRLDPALPTGLLVRPGTPPADVPAIAAGCGAHLVCPHHSLVDGGLGDWARVEGRPLLVWTVNKSRPLRRFLDDPAVGIVVTDRVQLARAILNGSRG